jgi:hypothetical protein
MENKTVDINIPAGGLRMPLDNGAGGPQPVMIHDIILKVSMDEQPSMPAGFWRGFYEAGSQSDESPYSNVVLIPVVTSTSSPQQSETELFF